MKAPVLSLSAALTFILVGAPLAGRGSARDEGRDPARLPYHARGASGRPSYLGTTGIIRCP